MTPSAYHRHTAYTFELLTVPGPGCRTRADLAHWLNAQRHHTWHVQPWTAPKLATWLRRQRQVQPPPPVPPVGGRYPVWGEHVEVLLHGDPANLNAEWTAVVEADVGPTWGGVPNPVHIFPTPTAALDYQYARLFARRRQGAVLVYDCRGVWEPEVFMYVETLYGTFPRGPTQQVPGCPGLTARQYWEVPTGRISPFPLKVILSKQQEWLQQLSLPEPPPA